MSARRAAAVGALVALIVAALLYAAGYAAGRAHGRDSRDLASRIEGHINHLVSMVGCQ